MHHFLSLPVDYESVGDIKEKVYFRNKMFSLKNELHITIIGSNLSPLIKEKLETNRSQKRLFLQAVAETNWCYELFGQYYHLVKDIVREDNNTTHLESIIQMAHIPGLEKFYKRLEAIFDIQILPRPAHITLYTFGNQRGISVDTQRELEEYSYGEVTLDQLKNP